jgi:hypothetical protein
MVQCDELPSQRQEINSILNAREKTHGSWQFQSSCSQELKKVARGYGNYEPLCDAQREAVDMILHKISRIVCGDPNFKDHWDDIAGYATLVSRELK